MTDGARETVRNAALMLVQRGAQTVGGLCFAVLVPRLMGPEPYGRYALATSVAAWLALLSGLGLVNATTRYLPQLIARGETAALHRLIGNLFTLRVASGLLAALLYVAVARWWWRDLDGVVPLVMALTVWVQGVSGYLFSLFLGFNLAGRWAAGDTARRGLLVVLVLLGYHLDGLGGAIVGVLLTEATVLGLGLVGNPLLKARHRLQPDRRFLAPYFRFGVTSLVTQVLLIAFLGTGEILVRTFSGRYAEVGYFSLAQGAYLVVATTLPQLMLAFMPLLVQLREAGARAEVARWNVRLVRLLSVGGVILVFAAWFLSKAYVPLLFGTAYAPVAANLLPLAAALLALALASVPGLLALVHERPLETVVAAALRLVVFWAIGPALIVRAGSFGACVAILAGAATHSLYLLWRTRHLMNGALFAWAVPVGLGLLFLPLAVFLTGGPMDAGLFGAGALVYSAALVLFRVVSPGEIAAVGHLLRGQRIRRGQGEVV
jgi:O-antigen/teichoic acid export membrane protein